ncbi:MAG: hypothetical protein SVY53_08465 [Chloroflexota bacterium]|nr:hypothetical protein [Chloroflexota bacterium]
MKFIDRPDFVKDRTEIEYSISTFAEQHGLMIHPKKDVNSWATKVVSAKGCPCVAERLDCPCDEALGDIDKAGVCRCLLLCTQDRYRIFAEGIVD